MHRAEIFIASKIIYIRYSIAQMSSPNDCRSQKWREMYQEKLNGGDVRKRHALPAIQQLSISKSNSTAKKFPASPRHDNLLIYSLKFITTKNINLTMQYGIG